MTFTVLLINCGSCKASVQLNRQLNMLFLIFTKAITAEYTTRACCKWDWMAVVPSWTPLRCVLESGTLLGRHNGHILHLAQLAFSLTCRRYAKILVIEWWCPGPLLPEQKYQCGRKERVSTSLTLHWSEANISCIQLLLSCTTNLRNHGRIWSQNCFNIDFASNENENRTTPQNNILIRTWSAKKIKINRCLFIMKRSESGFCLFLDVDIPFPLCFFNSSYV